MAEVFKLGIAANNNQPIKEVNSIEVLANKGIVGDRHFHDFNDPYNQLSLIESENIDEYNIKFGLDIPYIDFRRNVITKGIQLNELIGKKLKVGNLGDHRIAMCAFILGILTNSKTNIKNFETVFTSSPSFLKIMKSLGAKFEIKKK